MKTLFPFSLLLLFATFSFGQNILLEETFDNSGWSLPSGWTSTSHANSDGWNVFSYAIAGIPASSSNGTKIAISSDVTGTDSAHIDYLVSPIVSFGGANNALLTFDYLLPGTSGSNGYVEISTDLGITWNVIDTLSATGVNQTIERTAAINLSAYVGEPTVRLRFHHTDNQQATNADFFAIDNVKVIDANLLDAKVLTLKLDKYMKAESLFIIGTFLNKGLEPINSIKLNYSINDGPVATTQAPINSVLPGQVSSFIHLDLAYLSTVGKNTVKFWFSDLNGIGDDNPGDDTLVQDVFVVSSAPAKNLFFGYLTGTWCGFCPDGTVRLNNIKEANPQWNIHVATLHSNDAMSFPNGDTLLREFTNSYPSGMIDFMQFPEEDMVGISRGDWSDKMNTRNDAISPLSINFVDAGWDSTTRLLSAIARIDAFTDLDPNMRLNFWIMEDSVTGTGFGYDQVNFYNTVAGHPYYNAGSPIVGYVHENTLRHMMFGPWGAPGSIPLLKDGESYELTLSWPVPQGYDENQLKIMAMVFNYDGVNKGQMESFNSAYMRLPLTPMTSNNTSIGEDLQAKVHNVYPNPFMERLAIEFEIPKTNYTKISVVDLFGREIRTILSGTTGKGINTAYWDGRGETGNKVSRGVYMIRIETGGKATYQKVIFEG